MISFVATTGPLLSTLAPAPGRSSTPRRRSSLTGFSTPAIRMTPTTLELSDQLINLALS